MLLELRVENLLLIERAELRFGAGLNAITGETGAGKTVLAHSLDLLLGGKPRGGIVRPGADEAWVEGVFEAPPGALAGDELAELRERLPDHDGQEIVLARRVSASGRSRAFVAGRSATAADLRALGGRLVAFYGQHEHRKLTLAAAQLELLDAFCGEDHLIARSGFADAYTRVRELSAERDELRERAAARERDLDLLVFELDEIESLDPSEDDERELRCERERARHLEALRAAAAGAAEALAPEAAEAEGLTSLAAAGEALLNEVEGVDGGLDPLAERMRALRIEADDLAGELRRYEGALDGEPGRLEEIEQRLDLYDRLERKHGGSVASVLEHAERCRSERDRLEGAEEELERVEAALAEAEADHARRAAALTATRTAAAPRYAARVREELGALALAEASFEVRIEPREQPGPAGCERVEFLIAPNPGVPPALLRESASGGELSRVMLALMSVASAERTPTIVFDEVDAGVGGQTARAVGERLRALAHERQVLCITHLPQIASLAQSHFRIEKDAAGGLASAEVEALEGDRVVEELCRMLGADGADAGARRHAEELLEAA